MNEEIRCITNEGKTAKNEWENDDSDFLPALYIAYKKLGQFFFHTLLANLFNGTQGKNCVFPWFYSIHYKNASWLLLTFFICLHNLLSSVQKFENCDASNR